MVDTNELGSYTKSAEFEDKGKYVVDKKEFHSKETFTDQQSGKTSTKLLLKFLEKSRPTIMNNMSVKALAAEWGAESDDWVGKTVEAELVTQNVRGTMLKVVYFKPSED